MKRHYCNNCKKNTVQWYIHSRAFICNICGNEFDYFKKEVVYKQ